MLDEVLRRLAIELEAQYAPEELSGRVREALVLVMGNRPVRGLSQGVQAEVRELLSTASVRPVELFEQALDRVVRRTESGVDVVVQRGRKRTLGSFYTDEAVSQFMAARAREFMPSATSAIDPACGAGAFLLALRQIYGEKMERLAGMDLDPAALTLCAQTVPGASLHLQDALLTDHGATYDICLGNPPYVSSGLRGAQSMATELSRKLRARFPNSAQYKLNSYPLFIERGLELVREGGLIGYILPDSFLTGRYFEKVRRLLRDQTLLELILIRENFWQWGLVGQSVILFARKARPPSGHRVHVRICDRVADLEMGSDAYVEEADLLWGPAERFRLIPDPQDRAFLRHLEMASNVSRISDWVRTYSGLIGRAGQHTLRRSQNPAAPGPWGRLLASGREVDRYRVEWQGEEVCLHLPLIKSGGDLPVYAKPKLLLRQTGDCLRAAFDDSGLYCLNNIHLVLPLSPQTPLRWVLALLNSRTVDRYYRLVTMETDRIYAQIDLDLVNAIPVPQAAASDIQRVSELVRAREKAATHGEAASVEAEIEVAVRQLYQL